MRAILHSDLNSFFASVETALDPSLKGKAVAVCGSSEERRGIVLAKSDLAKKAGVKTGMVNFKAKKLCSDLITVAPKFSIYSEYSKKVKSIYEKYTDLVEPFGIDECWLDVTENLSSFGEPSIIANMIREEVRSELDLTLSIGISFNKVFAKLASDLAERDSVEIIKFEDFKKKIYRLPASKLLFLGKKSDERLSKYGIKTIGDLAKADRAFLKKILGINGEKLWIYANGLDDSPVISDSVRPAVKSISNGMTARRDLKTCDEVKLFIGFLSREVAFKLKKNSLLAKGISISVKNSDFAVSQYRGMPPLPLLAASDIADFSYSLFERHYGWEKDVRSVTVSAVKLMPESQNRQLSFYDLDPEAMNSER